MKFSENWLREYIGSSITSDDIITQLTMLGLEVDSVETVAPKFSGIIVAQVIALEAHPDADKLRICQVNTGIETVQIVCGAQNVIEGGKYPLATVGAVLPSKEGNDFKIKRAKLRGIESFGMLCSAAELGIAETAEGLMTLAVDASIGQDIREYLQLDDQSIEVDLTPNRGDCLSVLGIARELAALNGLSLNNIDHVRINGTYNASVPVTLSAGQACPRYAGRVIKNIDNHACTPSWLSEKLRRSGIRSLGPVVDVTNYVMLELGQPMHAFDLDTLQGGITVRYAKKNEVVTLLDDNQHKLDDKALIIADDKMPLALAGIMGGVASAVSDKTSSIFLESAFFSPTALAGVARRYGLHTDSSHRFERGVDPELCLHAIERATKLLLDIVGGEAGPVTHVSIESHLPKQTSIRLRSTRIERLLGFAIPPAKIESLLAGLGMSLQQVNQGEWEVGAPSYRFDINIEADLVEELVRLLGYDNIPTSQLKIKPVIQNSSEKQTTLNSLCNSLHSKGYQEVVSYSFVDPAIQQICDPERIAISLDNPISSDLAVMRTNMLPGLAGVLKYNLNRQIKNLKIYEKGMRFILQNTDIKQENVLAGLCYGENISEQWSVKTQTLDFFDIKADVESLVGSDAVFYALTDHPVLHPGQSAEIRKNGHNIGILGALHPIIEKQLDVSGSVYFFELQLSSLLSAQIPKFAALSRFQQNRRDIAIEIDQTVCWNEVRQTILKSNVSILQEVLLFDIYTGKGVTIGRKSFAIGLILQEFSRTLTDEEIDSAVQVIIQKLNKKVGATLRN